MRYPSIVHHGATTGVTGSCHQLQVDDKYALLIDSGLFQSAETSSAGRAGAGSLAPDFSLDGIKALVAVTAHTDYVGPMPGLRAVSCKRPIFRTESSVWALLIVLKDAFKLGFSRDPKKVERDLKLIELPILASTQTDQPAIAITGNDICSSGRIVNYLKVMRGDARHDVLTFGCQATGTPVRQAQCVGSRNGYVEFDGQRYDIRAQVHTIGGYSAHADQSGLVRFVSRMSAWPNEIRPVHGEKPARRALAGALRERYVDQSSDVDILLPGIDEETGMG
ncbi:hypothetical protein H3221_009180 [Pseudomonas sp. LMG 31766]|uniref:Zn-dependent metallo-hydrolase RNA specificity domain-containing protein n=1 Tax=Pseudomonas chaetocerotis TaxID=2758695 RepID=A0A931D200_9PSED|nr:MBL fold metallo-hydrolase RNA specificity domain-containing protein [Pseudomonas chaetocerotis]MBZ9664923.1 hypothetical protein [Pseudomonas chaetocerotis]